jgi:hypothetical protein
MMMELTWDETARLVGAIGESVLPVWLKRSKKLEGYSLWRGKPVVRRSFREELLEIFRFYDLENEKLYRYSRGHRLPTKEAECPVCGKVFSRGQYPYEGMMRHVYKWHKDVCRGYDYVKAYLDRILYRRYVDNILFRETSRLSIIPQRIRANMRTLEDFETVFADLMGDLAPIISEVKTTREEIPRELSEDQREIRELALSSGWGWLLLAVNIGEKVTAEDVELHMPDDGKITHEVHRFFQSA